MPTPKPALNPDVDAFLDKLKHPAREQIDLLRKYILSAHDDLVEDVKWNAPNFSLDGEDRITMKIVPPSSNVLVILHCGAQKKSPPKIKLISHESPLLSWKGNDRAILTFATKAEITKFKSELIDIIKEWIKATT